MPACDLLAGYILGLLNDDVTWLQESLTPLRRTLFQIYGLAQSPLTASMQKHFAEEVDGVFDFKTDTFTFAGTNGWMWRLHFGQPLTKGCKVDIENHVGGGGTRCLTTSTRNQPATTRCPASLKPSSIFPPALRCCATPTNGKRTPSS